MERPNQDSDYGYDRFDSSQDTYEKGSHQSPRLSKKVSAGGHLTRQQSQQQHRTNVQHDSFHAKRPGLSDGGNEDVGRQRKSSLRNVVRRIFGKKARSPAQVEPQQLGQACSPPRHAYHRSEPPQPPPHAAGSEEHDEDHLPHRTLSAPLQITPTPVFASRLRSPYAVEFPQSARLKPLNLGNPLPASGKQLKRRKTLPSVLLADRDAAKLKKSLESPVETPPIPELEDAVAPAHETARVVSRSKRSKRRSRSAGDLKGDRAPSVPRKRSEEIRYWRESMHGGVLRMSGFTNYLYSELHGEQAEPTLQVESPPHKQDEDTTPTAEVRDPFTHQPARPAAINSSPRSHRPTISEADIRSASNLGTEMSQDLEDRVARLESGLHSFQRSLQRLTAQSNRKTVILGGIPATATARGSINTIRTPSMLADTLFDPDGAPNYNLESLHSPQRKRPSTSPETEPRTPDRSRRVPRSPALPAVPPLMTTFASEDEDEEATNQTPFQASTQTQTPPSNTRTRSYSDFPLPPCNQNPTPYQDPAHHSQLQSLSTSPPPSREPQAQLHCLQTLYRMLSTERSERRKLQALIRGMRAEILELQGRGIVTGSDENSGVYCDRDEGMGVGVGEGIGAGCGGAALVGKYGEFGCCELDGESLGCQGLHGQGLDGKGLYGERLNGEGINDAPGLRSYFRDSGTTTPGTFLHEPSSQAQVVSRFSGSEGIGGDGDGDGVAGVKEVRAGSIEGVDGGRNGRSGGFEYQSGFEGDDEGFSTPYEAYQTPVEEMGGKRFGFGGREGGMF